jgi:hypothetical protein
MGIKQTQERLETFERFISEADSIARARGKTIAPKRPLHKNGLTLVLRNIDENSRDETGSVNSIQVAMNIGAAAALQGMKVLVWKSQDLLHFLIEPLEQEGEHAEADSI